MKMLKKIRQFIADFLKKRYIRKELESNFEYYNKDMNKRNRDRLDVLTNSLFHSSKITKTEVLDAERKRLEHQNELLFGDIKNVIDKHYKDREETLKTENSKLERKLIEKEKTINKIKEKISTVVSKN